uniref:Uncharacterized protein n=1 Tax=Candidatus Kentrum sp. TC TaxID=2126339 RepID=A0A450YR38_9GAMM|nr:MAG: hypothetical protein BECKTC1821E_GA0114239_103032 [Candidatus Kentron sp. TC]
MPYGDHSWTLGLNFRRNIQKCSNIRSDVFDNNCAKNSFLSQLLASCKYKALQKNLWVIFSYLIRIVSRWVNLYQVAPCGLSGRVLRTVLRPQGPQGGIQQLFKQIKNVHLTLPF